VSTPRSILAMKPAQVLPTISQNDQTLDQSYRSVSGSGVVEGHPEEARVEALHRQRVHQAIRRLRGF
jgi:hypothetical protein